MDGNSLTPDAFEVRQNSVLQFLDVLQNDSSAGAIAAVSYGSEGGTIRISEDRQAILYAPPADFFGTESFVYFTDNQLSATVTVTVQAPLLSDDYKFFPTGEVKVLDVLANDPFWSNYDGPRKITAVSETLLGSKVTISSDGKTLLYTAPTTDYGKDAFVYIVDGIYPAQVTIEVPSPIKDDSFPGLVQNTESNVLDVLANDPFWDGYSGAGQITNIGKAPSSGTVAIAQDGKSLIYTPSPDYIGGDSFTYVVDGIYEATVSLQVHRPVQDDQFEIDQNTTNYGMFLIPNDMFSYYKDGMWITCDVIDRITSVGETAHGGTVEIMADGQGVIYSAPAGFVGTDTFEYIADGKHHATVTVHVTSPVRDDAFYNRIYEDTIGNVLYVMENDFLGNGYSGPRLITAVSETSAGGRVTIAADGRSLLYTPASGFRGTDTFHYTVDGQLQAEVQVFVGMLSEGDHYVYYPDSFGTTGALNVLNNDHFWQNYPGLGIITAVGETANGGQVTISDDGKFLWFTPAAGKADHFTYTVDGKYQASVYVSFYSCLRSDLFVVDQNSGNTELTPLNNDFITWNDGRWQTSSSYAGPRQITAASTETGTVTIATDGKTLFYTPAPDFYGEARITYTVDGIMQETISVQVIRRVRDDVYHVERGSHENILPVLINDLFGADYKGAGLVTGISATDAGGTVSISADGKSICYTPPAGFKGKDSFTYTVDGRLKAKAAIYVGNSPSEILSQFDSREELIQSLLDEAMNKYDHLFGQVVEEYPVFMCDASYASVGSRNYSDTNVQVAGVDEGDIVENDGSYLYVLTGGKLVICRAWPAEEMEIVSQMSIQGSPIAEYLYGDRLTVISQIPRTYAADYGFASLSLSIENLISNNSTEASSCPFHLPPNAETIITVFDVSDRASPKIVEVTALDGRYVESRRIEDKIFLVLRNDRVSFQLPEPTRILVSKTDSDKNAALTAGSSGALLGSPVNIYSSPFSFSGSGSYVYESREEYLQRIMDSMDSIIDSIMPHFSSFGPDGELLLSGVLHEPEDIAQIGCNDPGNLISIVSLDIDDNKPGITESTGIRASGASVIYGSLDNLYLFDQVSTLEDGVSTQILQFDWNAQTGKIHLAAKGRVAGQMLNQFSVDEFEGNLRIATTISNSCSGNWSNRFENVLFVLRNDGGVLETIGGLQNMALGESISSVRFLGNRAFITTFRDIDPLVALDLSDPNNPLSCGHVTMPGFNSYMQLIDENHILAVGRNSPAGFNGPTQITLFDIQDLSRPRIIDSYTFERFSTSMAENDHHAFGWFADHQVLAMPTSRTYWERVDNNGDGYREGRRSVSENQLVLFKIDINASQSSSDGIKLLGQVEHDSQVRRGAFIDNVLYSIADTSIRAVSILDPTVEIASVDINVLQIPVFPPINPIIHPVIIVPRLDPEIPPLQPPTISLPNQDPIAPALTPMQPEISPLVKNHRRTELHAPWAIISSAYFPYYGAELVSRLSAPTDLVSSRFNEEPSVNSFNRKSVPQVNLPKVSVWDAGGLTLIDEIEAETDNEPRQTFDQIAAYLDFNLLHEVILSIEKEPLDKKAFEFLFANYDS